MLSEDEYITLARRELDALISALDDLELDGLSAELENDIISIELGSAPSYVINSHRAARQIWMAAERTAWHFDFDPEEQLWIAHKTGEELWGALSGVLARKVPGFSGLVRPAL